MSLRESFGVRIQVGNAILESSSAATTNTTTSDAASTSLEGEIESFAATTRSTKLEWVINDEATFDSAGACTVAFPFAANDFALVLGANAEFLAKGEAAPSEQSAFEALGAIAGIVLTVSQASTDTFLDGADLEFTAEAT